MEIYRVKAGKKTTTQSNQYKRKNGNSIKLYWQKIYRSAKCNAEFLYNWK